MSICPTHKDELGKYWRSAHSCQYPSRRGKRKRPKDTHVSNINFAREVFDLFGCTVPIGSHGVMESTLEVHVVYEHEGSVWESKWNEATPEEKRICLEKSEEACRVVCDIIAPEEGSSLYNSLLSKSYEEKISADLVSLMTAFADAPTRKLKLQILNIEKKIQIKCNNSSMTERRGDMLYDIKQAEKDIFEWKAYIMRATNQQKGTHNVLQQLDENTFLVIMDWAIKFQPRKYREKQCEWFGKRGLSRYTVKGEYPEKTKAFLRSDEAGCYHSNMFILACNDISKSSGVQILGYDFSEPESGKDICDEIIFQMKSSIKTYCNEGHNILSAIDVHSALKERSVTRVTASVGVTDETKILLDIDKVQGISKYHNFRFEKRDWAMQFSTTTNLKTKKDTAKQEDLLFGSCSELCEGWALATSSGNVRFAEHLKAYVTTKFDFRIATGKKLTPKEVPEDMRRARNEEGERLFSREEWVKESQKKASSPGWRQLQSIQHLQKKRRQRELNENNLEMK
ncbi:hypothetical protein AWC38_SpisGene12352 [Stylophora pistillata]|uniref:Uncharacterized protein n=1 Tax=Stylophora pistillata TaxID=50429 RepID=A0A2B4S3N4_STYPI|nr:hypothetical protein AWC38_SpisGene12352 [Stylophora pistillata]